MAKVELKEFLVSGKWVIRTVAQRFLTMADMPIQPRSDDLYIVEFPKSGITWLSFLVANTNLILSGDSRNATFYNILDFVPDIHVSRDLAPPTLPMPGFRIIKSHGYFNPRYQKVFYLVRDPRHVMISYFRFLTQLGWFRGSFEQMLDHPRYGIGAWRRHVLGWIDGVSPTSSFALIRYEDLLDDTGTQLSHLYRLLGIELPKEVVDKAISRSSMERMRKDELVFNDANPASKKLDFVRAGEPGGGRERIDEKLERRIDAEVGEILKRLRYRNEPSSA
jgi:hypothetical protein